MAMKLMLRCRMHPADYIEFLSEEVPKELGEMRLNMVEMGKQNTIYLNRSDLESLKKYIDEYLANS